VATLVDPENGFAPSMTFLVKLPTIEFNYFTDSEDDSTLGDDTLYMMDAMTTIDSLHRSSTKRKQMHEKVPGLQVTQDIQGNSDKIMTKKAVKKSEAVDAAVKEATSKKSSKKTTKKTAARDNDSGSNSDKPMHKKSTKNAAKGKKGHKLPKESLDTIAETA
jgi:hypothetical protein